MTKLSGKMYMQVSQERYDILQERYNKYLEGLNDETKDPVRVFDPLPQKMLDDLVLIREVSRELQNKKDEDLKKAAQAAKQAEEEAKKAAEQKAKEKAEEVKEVKEEKESK